MPLLWQIALKQLLARRRQAISIVAGVVLGVTVLLVTISLFGGLLDSFTEKVLDVAPHVTMKAGSAAGSDLGVLVEGGQGGGGVAVELERNRGREERATIRNIMTTLRSIERALGDRLTAASPFLSTQALAAYGTQEATLPINGVLPYREARIGNLGKHLLSGSIERLDGTRMGVLVGEKAAADLGVRYGDRIRLVSLSGELYNAQVVGVYRLGIESADRSALVNLRLAQALERALPGEASGIAFQLRDVSDAPEVARSIERITGRKTETWQQSNAGILSVFTFLQVLFYVVVSFVVVICGFGVANILITSVIEKQRDIAVMKSYGFSSGEIARMYLLQGVVIAVVGSLVGSLAGALAITLVARIPVGSTGGFSPVESSTLQMGWSPWYFAVATGGMIVASLLAAVAPARAAARVAPADILRSER
jgi:lipoprotein-releasing system permease protein